MNSESLSNRDRFLRTLRYEPVDRRPVYLAGPWHDTILRWNREGGFVPGIDHSVPADVSWDDYRRYLDLLIKTATA
jgi:hypothetical protein